MMGWILLVIMMFSIPQITAAQGLSELYPWPCGPNLLKNPSIEEVDAAGKPLHWAFSTKPTGIVWSRSNEAASDGSWSIRMLNANLSSTAPLVTQSLPGSRGGWYNVSARAKTLDLGVQKPESYGRVSVVANQAGGGKTDGINGTNDWTVLDRHSFFVDNFGIKRIQIETYQKPDGTAYFDEISLCRQIPALAHGFLLYPNYRGYLWTDKPQTVKMMVTLSPDDHNVLLRDMRVRLTLEAEDGSPISSREVIPTAHEFEIDVDATTAPLEGQLSLRLQVFAAGSEFLAEYPKYLLKKVTPETRATFAHYVDEYGRWIREGQPAFILGIYNTTGYSANPNYWIPTADKWQEAGINAYINYWLPGAPLSVLNVMMDVYRQRGMYYLHTINNMYETSPAYPNLPVCDGKKPLDFANDQEYTACRVRELAPHPGLLGWYTADERPAEKVPSVFTQYKTVRENDLDGLTYIVLNKPLEIDRWMDTGDNIATDPYPVWEPPGTLSPLEMVGQWTKKSVDGGYGTRPVWTVIQLWDASKAARFPTYDDLRSMSWLAIINGATGLFYWSYGARGLAWVDPPELREEYWQNLKKVTLEVKSLDQFLLSTEKADLIISTPPWPIQSLAKKVGNVHLLMTVNANPTQITDAKFIINSTITSVEVVGENRTIPVVNGEFLDTFIPYQVHNYRLVQN